MQNQVNVDPEPHYIIRSGGMVNLSELVSKASAGRQHTLIHLLCVRAVMMYRNDVTKSLGRLSALSQETIIFDKKHLDCSFYRRKGWQLEQDVPKCYFKNNPKDPDRHWMVMCYK